MDPRMAMMVSQGGENFKSGLGQFLSGIFNDAGAPYEKAMDQYTKYLNQGRETQNPFYSAGTGAIPKVQDWLSSMQDPSGFINNLMNKYQESPAARYLKQQAMRAGTNAASASGLTGSTPFLQQMQQNASNISSQDMNQWLQNVLGINTQYGAGETGLMQGGQNAANSIMQLLQHFGELMGEGAYGREAGEQQNTSNKIGGLLNMFM